MAAAPALSTSSIPRAEVKLGKEKNKRYLMKVWAPTSSIVRRAGLSSGMLQEEFGINEAPSGLLALRVEEFLPFPEVWCLFCSWRIFQLWAGAVTFISLRAGEVPGPLSEQEVLIFYLQVLQSSLLHFTAQARVAQPGLAVPKSPSGTRGGEDHPVVSIQQSPTAENPKIPRKHEPR